MEDHEKLARIITDLGIVDENNSLHRILDTLKTDMETEDPEELIYCSCHGELHPRKDVDVWGNCPYGR